ncbi:hypothetical protein ACJMK2_006100 [Sinanodonta woodiana]
METYLMMLYVTLEQENAIRELFLQKGWCLMKIDNGKDTGKEDIQKGMEQVKKQILYPKIISKSPNIPTQNKCTAVVQSTDLVAPLEILNSESVSLNPCMSKLILIKDKRTGKLILSQTPTADTDASPVKQAKLSHSVIMERHQESKFIKDFSCQIIKQVSSEGVTQSAKETKISSVDTDDDDDSVLENLDIQYVEVNSVDDSGGSLEILNNLNEKKYKLHNNASREPEAISMNKSPPKIRNFDPTMVQGRDKKGKFTTEKVPGSGKSLGTEDNQFFLTCKDCKKRLPSHQFNCHKDRGECVVKCTCCGAVFEGKDLANYKAHVKTHCKCDLCHSMFMIESDLKIHLKTHVGQRMFACTCGAMFASVFDLNSHTCSVKNTK